MLEKVREGKHWRFIGRDVFLSTELIFCDAPDPRYREGAFMIYTFSFGEAGWCSEEDPKVGTSMLRL